MTLINQMIEVREDVDLDVLTYVNNFITVNSYPNGVPRRVTISCPQIVNGIVESLNKVKVFYQTKDIGLDFTEGNEVAEELIVKKIEYRFPKSETIIEVGDFLYDSFDLEKESSETQRQILTGQVK